MSFRKSLQKSLSDHLKKQKENPRGPSQVKADERDPEKIFFKEFYAKSGTALFFLFKKNLSVTNIQFSELLSLIRAFAENADGQQPGEKLQFINTDELYERVAGIIHSFDPIKEAQIKVIDKLFGSLFNNLIVFNVYHGSAAVFLPPSISLDLARVAGHSGYVHSCGYAVFLRETEKATEEDFLKYLGEHLRRYYTEKEEVLFVPYSHEDFTQFDRLHADNLEEGLDEVKIHVEKFYLGKERFVRVLNRLRDDPRFPLRIPPAGNYNKVHDNAELKEGLVPGRCLWIISDRSIDINTLKAGKKRYFICYDQRWANHNPFHLFDENKPGWIAHTTAPHTLTGAMLNLTRPWWRGGNVQICDPFAGSGTLLLESQKEESVRCTSSDLKPSVKQVYSDNEEFFRLSAADLEILIEQLDSRIHSSRDSLDYGQAKKLFDQIRPAADGDDLTFTKRSLRRFRDMPLTDRIIFYVMLRTIRRHDATFEREAADFFQVFVKEMSKLIIQMKHLLNLKKRSDESSKYLNRFSTFLDVYSHAITLTLNDEEVLFTGEISEKNAKNLEKKNAFDVIITDPPYGFNTKEGVKKLADLYEAVMPEFLDALKPEGQLVFSLPEQSFTGRQSPYFVHQEIVKLQLLKAAADRKSSVYSPAFCVPALGLFRPPYYWESKRALRRAILHFHIRKLP